MGEKYCHTSVILSYLDSGKHKTLPKTITEDTSMNNCFCRLFEDNTIWLIIIAILLVSYCNEGRGGCGCGCGC
jgi:hypothetical protein